MRLYPAVDILGGSAVRLVRGDFEQKKVYDQDPLAAARAWVDAGAEYLHVVDLDGARVGEPVNLAHLERIVREVAVPVQYGGGLRSPADVALALRAGAARVILGTIAFSDTAVLEQALAAHGPQEVLVAVDVREGCVATHGWAKRTTMQARDAFAKLRERGARHFVFTNIDHDGMLDGANREEVAWVCRAAGEGSVIISGGIASREDLQALARLRSEQALEGLDGVIVGTALYEGRLTVAEAKSALAG